MNKLILIGNGFDLAHGMKTSYNDFILWYLIKCYTAAYNDGEYKDEAMYIIGDKSLPLDIDLDNSVESFINFFYEKNNLGNLIAEKFKTNNRSFEYVNPFKTTIKYKLIHTLLSKCTHCDWVEIENEYYEQLKSILIDQFDFKKSKRERN